MMKTPLATLAVSTVLALAFSLPVSAQGMMGWRTTTTSDPTSLAQTAQDEAAGKAIWLKLQEKSVICAALTDDDFDVLGDYFMGLMAGTTASHDAMNLGMTARMGDAAEKQMHIAMGKRSSGCDGSAAFPAGYSWTMMGGGNGFGAGMMSRGGDTGYFLASGFHWFGFATMALVWLVLILSVVALITFISKSRSKK